MTLLSNAALRPTPSIISTAELPAKATTSGLIPYMTLGGIFGLILALGTAGLVEMIRPTFVGEDALAREFDAPLLGRLSGVPGEASLGVDTTSLADRIRLAGEGLRGTRCLASRRRAAGRPEVARCRAHTSERQFQRLAQRLRRRQRPYKRAASRSMCSTLHTWSPNGGGAGLVLVSPHALKKEDLIEANRLLELSRLPVLGLITYDGERPRRPIPPPVDPFDGEAVTQPAHQGGSEKVHPLELAMNAMPRAAAQRSLLGAGPPGRASPSRLWRRSCA